MPEYVVRLPLGTVKVRLERNDKNLGQRGGFEAQWADAERDTLSTEAYRQLAKAHLKDVYKQNEGGEPSPITLNLASHQLLDDLIGWSKLNYPMLEGDDG